MSSQAPNSPSRPQASTKREAAAAYPSSGALDEVTPFVYGTTRLRDAALPFAERVAMARRAMAAGVWIHTSAAYGSM